jgi:hypothetical protein
MLIDMPDFSILTLCDDEKPLTPRISLLEDILNNDIQESETIKELLINLYSNENPNITFEVLELLLNRPGPYLTDDEIKEWFEKFKKK